MSLIFVKLFSSTSALRMNSQTTEDLPERNSLTISIFLYLSLLSRYMNTLRSAFLSFSVLFFSRELLACLLTDRLVSLLFLLLGPLMTS